MSETTSSRDPWQIAMDNVEQMNREAKAREERKVREAVTAELRAQADKLDLIATRATALHDFTAAALVLRQRADELEGR